MALVGKYSDLTERASEMMLWMKPTSKFSSGSRRMGETGYAATVTDGGRTLGGKAERETKVSKLEHACFLIMYTNSDIAVENRMLAKLEDKTAWGQLRKKQRVMSHTLSNSPLMRGRRCHSSSHRNGIKGERRRRPVSST